jgi:hypothetical protein
MSQDVTTAFYAVQAEQRLIAKRAERAWIVDEARRQGRVSRADGPLARIGTMFAVATRRFGRRPAETPAIAPASRQRSAGAL